MLAPLAVIPLIVYPYAKRFTNWPHAILGVAQLIGPVGAWLAVTGTFRGSGPAWVLGAAVGLWIGGFDLIYACQDVDIDREIGVHSVPARYGVPVRAVRVDGRARGDVRAVRLVRRARRIRLAVVGRAGGDRGRVHLRARDRQAVRPVPGEPGVLHRQRLRRHRTVRVRAARPAWCGWTCGADGGGVTERRSGGRGSSAYPERPGRRTPRPCSARSDRRRRVGRPGRVAGGPPDHPRRDRRAVPGRALARRPGRVARQRHAPTRTSSTGRPATWRPDRAAGPTRRAA